jgi:hypothetical protein
MRLLLVGFGIAVLAAVGWIFGWAVQESREWREIVALSEKDLFRVTIEEESRVSAVLEKRYPRPDFPWGLPWAGLRLPGSGSDERIVLFHGGGLMWPPAISMIPISVLDGERRDRSVTWVLPGNDARIVGISRSVSGAPVPWCFGMTVDPKRENQALERHIYALIDEKPVLIRLEDDRGAPRPNDYRSPYDRVGEEVPERSAEDWERGLYSSELGEVLRALMWLGGLHYPPGEPSGSEESASSRLSFAAALERPGVKARLRELLGHPHPWVAEAAAQVELPD